MIESLILFLFLFIMLFIALLKLESTDKPIKEMDDEKFPAIES